MHVLLQKLRDSSERPTLNQSRRSICVVYTLKPRLCKPKPHRSLPGHVCSGRKQSSQLEG